MLVFAPDWQEVEELDEIDFTKEYAGNPKEQQLGRWVVDKRRAWAMVLVAVRVRHSKDWHWTRTEWILSRWQRYGMRWKNRTQIRIRHNVLAELVGTNGKLRECWDKIDKILPTLSDDPEDSLPEGLPLVEPG